MLGEKGLACGRCIPKRMERSRLVFRTERLGGSRMCLIGEFDHLGIRMPGCEAVTLCELMDILVHGISDKYDSGIN